MAARTKPLQVHRSVFFCLFYIGSIKFPKLPLESRHHPSCNISSLSYNIMFPSGERVPSGMFWTNSRLSCHVSGFVSVRNGYTAAARRLLLYVALTRKCTHYEVGGGGGGGREREREEESGWSERGKPALFLLGPSAGPPKTDARHHNSAIVCTPPLPGTYDILAEFTHEESATTSTTAVCLGMRLGLLLCLSLVVGCYQQPPKNRHHQVHVKYTGNHLSTDCEL